MRILCTTERWFPDEPGGTARVARDVAFELADRGHDVTVLAPRVSGWQPQREDIGGVSILRAVRRHWAIPKTYSDPIVFATAIRSGYRDGFDVHLAHHPVGVAGLRLAGLSIPTAYVFHASPRLEAVQRRARGVTFVERLRSLAVEPPLWAMERNAVRTANRILTLSNYSKSLVDEMHPLDTSKVIVVGGAVDTDSFMPAGDRLSLRESLGIEQRTVQLITVRRLVARTGVDVLLRAMRLLDYPSARLLVIGTGELRSELERLRNSLGLESVVKFAGSLDEASVRAWYQAADLFVLPTIAYEGFGMATVEALSSGTPVVATDIGATREIVGRLDLRLIASHPSAESLAAAINYGIASISEQLRARCRQLTLTRFSWRHVGAAWDAALDAARR